MNSLATQAGVAATTVARLARINDKAASTQLLDLAAKIVTVLEDGKKDPLDVVEAEKDPPFTALMILWQDQRLKLLPDFGCQSL